MMFPKENRRKPYKFSLWKDHKIAGCPAVIGRIWFELVVAPIGRTSMTQRASLVEWNVLLMTEHLLCRCTVWFVRMGWFVVCLFVSFGLFVIYHLIDEYMMRIAYFYCLMSLSWWMDLIIDSKEAKIKVLLLFFEL